MSKWFMSYVLVSREEDSSYKLTLGHKCYEGEHPVLLIKGWNDRTGGEDVILLSYQEVKEEGVDQFGTALETWPVYIRS